MASTSKRIAAVLLDLSGTLHIDSNPTTGAIDALKRLQGSGIPIRYVTNTTKESSKRLHSRLTSMSFDIPRDHIFTSLVATRKYIESNHLRPLLFLEDAALEEFEGIPVDEPDAVVIGLAPSCFHYEKMNYAFQIIRNGGPLIAMHKARYFANTTGTSLGPGPFVTALEYATDTQAILIGKPQPSFFQVALDSLGLSEMDRNAVVMIGDDVRDDVGGAMEYGLQGYLVRTGKYTDNDENRYHVKPTRTFDTFANAVDSICGIPSDP